MTKFYIRERIVIDSYGNCVRGAFNWRNFKLKGKTLFFDDFKSAMCHLQFLESLSKQYQYKIMSKEER